MALISKNKMGFLTGDITKPTVIDSLHAVEPSGVQCFEESKPFEG